MARLLANYSWKFVCLASTLSVLLWTIACGSSNSTQPTNPDTADFSVAVSPTALSLTPNVPQTLTITVTPTGGFTGDVTVSVMASSPHLTFSAPSVTVAAGASGKVTVLADTSLVNSSATVSVSAVSGTLSHNAQVSAQVGKVLTVNFAPRVDIPSGGTRPAYLAVADFNGDGHPDIAVSNTISNTISVFLGKGDGSFSAPVITPVTISNNLGAIVAGDFNEDQKQDLVVATVSGFQVTILLSGNGDGTFTQQPAMPNSFGFLRAVAVDVNNDHHLDLVLAGDGSCDVVLGAGDGTFPIHTSLQNASSPGTFFGITAADFNGDGKPDVAAIDYGGSGAELDLWQNQGNGNFQSAALSSLVYFGGAFIDSADFNQDQKQDLLVSFSNSAEVVPGNGDGTFDIANAHPIYAGTAPGQGAIAIAADMNLDGLPDAVATNYADGTMNILINDGSNFTTAGFPQPMVFTIAPNTGDVKVADFNGDGIPDVVVVNDATGNISLFLSVAPANSTVRGAKAVRH